MEEFSIDEQAVGLLTGVIVLTNGYANFVIVPCSNIFGRRFTCLIFGVVTVATQIWIALSHSYNSLLAARAVNGFATAINESIMVQVVADMFFVHERGVWTGIYL
jgi:MFS family permease